MSGLSFPYVNDTQQYKETISVGMIQDDRWKYFAFDKPANKMTFNILNNMESRHTFKNYNWKFSKN